MDKTRPKNCVTRRYVFKANTSGRRNLLQSMNSEGGVLVDWVLRASLEAQGFTGFDPESQNRSQYSPAKLWESLCKYDMDRAWNPNAVALKQAIALTKKAFALSKKVEAATLDESLIHLIKLDKSAGLPMLGKKADAFGPDLERAKHILEGTVSPPPCIAYHRTQFGAEGPKTRLVWGYPQSMTLIEACYAAPLIRGYIGNVLSPMAIGLHKNEVWARTRAVARSGVRYELDYSGFDSSICRYLIRVAFDILREQFSEVNESHWSRIVKYFIHTDILMPDGVVYRKSHGVPSGSYFTQLIDSVVNYIACQYIRLRYDGKKWEEGKILVLGDDSVIGGDVHIPIEAVASMAAELGLKINAEKSAVKTRGHVSFLGHTWVRGLPVRPVVDTAQRVVYAEKPSYDDSMANVRASRMLNGLCDNKDWWPHILKYLQEKRMTNNLREYPGKKQFRSVHLIRSGWQEALNVQAKIRGEDQILNTPHSLWYLGLLR